MALQSDELANSILNLAVNIHLFLCPSTKKLTDPLKEMFHSIQGSPISPTKLVALDLIIPSSLRLPAMFIMTEILQILLDLRKSHKHLDMAAAVAMIKAKSAIFLESKRFKFANTMANLWLRSFFNISAISWWPHSFAKSSGVKPSGVLLSSLMSYFALFSTNHSTISNLP